MLYEMNYDPSMRISLVKGNSKLGKGIWSFNLLPGDDPISSKDKGQLTNVRGTCGGCCDDCRGVCYAIRDARRFHNTCIPSLAKNTLIMRNNPNQMFMQLREEIIRKKVRIFRWHSSGEIESYDYLLRMALLALDFPLVKFYFYTKRFDLIERFLKSNCRFPDNLICNISDWKGSSLQYNLDGLNVFTYDDGLDDKMNNVAHCPAVDKKGNKTGVICGSCGRCFSGNNGIVTAVYKH